MVFDSCKGSAWFRILDSLVLLILVGLQGAVLNSYLITYNHWSSYGWLYFGDGIMIIIFAVALIISYRSILRKIHDKIEKHNINIPYIEVPMYGVLPFGYITWFIYSCYITAKVIMIFKQGIAADLKPEGFWDSSSLLKIALALTSAVFILLVNTHHDAEPNSTRNNYIADLCKGTTFDIMDSVSFVSILFYKESHVQDHVNGSMEDAILALACMNFMLPTLGLLKLSLSDFGDLKQPLRISLLYKVLKLLLINLPYMVVRLVLWETDTGVSMFLMKNVFGVVITLRYMIPEIVSACRGPSRMSDNSDEVLRPI